MVPDAATLAQQLLMLRLVTEPQLRECRGDAASSDGAACSGPLSTRAT